MSSLREPSRTEIDDFLSRQHDLPFSYAAVGATRGTPPSGYVVDHRRVCLGHGAATFDAACAALRRWEHFPEWTCVHSPTGVIEPGVVVAPTARVFALWWLNACRIVYVVEVSQPARRFGFAYGTLPGHVERGEERFLVEWLDDDTVWFDLLAFSQPSRWWGWLAYPLVRQQQRRFGRDACAAIRDAVTRRTDVAPREQT